MAGHSDEIMQEAKSVIMPEAKTGDPDDSEEEEDSSEDEKIGVTGRYRKTKMIQKQKKGQQ